MENNKRIELGREGEREAERYLKKKGYRILERNFRIKGGELDIVAEKDGEIVFVEVRTRENDFFMDPIFSITPKKRRSLRRAAEVFLLAKGLDLCPCRFDIITVLKKGRSVKIEHYENIFI